MNFKTTLVLIGLLVVAAIVFLLVDPADGPETVVPVQGDGTRVFESPDTLTVGDVQGVTIVRGDETLAIEKHEGQWQLVEPVAWQMRSGPIDQLVTAANALRYVQSFEPGQSGMPSLADAGLGDAPRVIVTFKTDGGDHTIKVGRATLGGRGFARLGGENQTPVLIVNDSLHTSLLETNFDDWRATRLDAPRLTALSGLELGTRAETNFEARRIDGRWMLGHEAAQRADRDALATLAEVPADLVIRKFVADHPDDLSLFGLDNPEFVLGLYPSNVAGESDPRSPKPARLVVGSPADLTGQTVHAAFVRGGADVDPSVVFTISKADVDKLIVDLDDLRDRRIALTPMTAIREAVLEQPAGQAIVHIHRTAEQFVFASDNSRAARPSFDAGHLAVEQWLGSISNATAQAFAPVPAPDVQPTAIIELIARGSGGDRLRIYQQPASGRVLVVRNNETIGAVVPDDQLSRWLIEPIELRHRTISRFKPAELRSIAIGRTSDGRSWTFTAPQPPSSGDPADAATWTSSGELPVESDALAALLAQLDELRVDRWLPEPVDQQGLTMTLTITPGEGEPTVLRVNPVTREAVITGYEHGVKLAASMVDALEAEFDDRTLVGAVVDDIKTVAITDLSAANEPTIILARKVDGELAATSGSGAQLALDRDKATALVDAVAGLRVERWVPGPVLADAPLRRFTVTLADDSRITFQALRYTNSGDSPTLVIDERGVFGEIAPEAGEALLADLAAPATP